jgi:peptidoglycan/LPS O-acetylase OafA/YrhL
VAEKSALAGRQTMRLTLAALCVAACLSLFFVVKLQPTSAGAFAFLAVWLALPHAAMAVLLLALQRKGKPVLPWCIAVAVVVLGGLYVLVDAIYMHPDAQSAIGVVLTPVLQVIAFVIAAPLAWWAGRRMSAE